jgi:hypothetical protein
VLWPPTYLCYFCIILTINDVMSFLYCIDCFLYCFNDVCVLLLISMLKPYNIV